MPIQILLSRYLQKLPNTALSVLNEFMGTGAVAAVGNYIRKISPDFDQRSDGFSKLADLIRSLLLLELKQKNNSHSFLSVAKVTGALSV